MKLILAIVGIANLLGAVLIVPIVGCVNSFAAMRVLDYVWQLHEWGVIDWERLEQKSQPGLDRWYEVAESMYRGVCDPFEAFSWIIAVVLLINGSVILLHVWRPSKRENKGQHRDQE